MCNKDAWLSYSLLFLTAQRLNISLSQRSIHWQFRNYIYSILWLDFLALAEANANKLLCSPSMWMYSSQVWKLYLCNHNNTGINAVKYLIVIMLSEKDGIACLHAKSTWLSETSQTSFKCKVSLLFDSLFSGGPVGRGYCPPSTPHWLSAWLILSRGSARKAVWITVSSPSLSLPSKMKGHFSPSHHDSPQDVSYQNSEGWLPRLPPAQARNRWLILEWLSIQCLCCIFYGEFTLYNAVCVEWSSKY